MISTLLAGLFPGRRFSTLPCFSRHRPGPGQRPEHLLARSANRALPILRKIFETSPLGHLALSVPSVRIIDITAVRCLALPHFFRFCHELVSFNDLRLQHKPLNESVILTPHPTEHVPRRTANRTNPSKGEIFKTGPRVHAVIGITVFRLIDETADLALVFFHVQSGCSLTLEFFQLAVPSAMIAISLRALREFRSPGLLVL